MADNEHFGRALAPGAEVEAWLSERIPAHPGIETVAVASAGRRTLAADVTAPTDLPSAPIADCDGIALAATQTAGAGLYSPLRLFLGTGGALPVALGERLPPGCDAAVSWTVVTRAPDAVVLTAPVAAGEHVCRTGADWHAGTPLAGRGDVLSPPRQSALLAAGVETVSVQAQPQVRCLAAGSFDDADVNGPLLQRLVARDGGVGNAATANDADTLRTALRTATEPIVLIHGASGHGARDFAATALADVGTLAWHGAAAVPGDSFGAGTLNGTTVLLLPGTPWACLAAYELFAASLVRRLAGLADPAPGTIAALPLAAKLASPLGLTELRAVAIRDGCALPLPQPAHAPPPAAAGFVRVEAASEGAAEGSSVSVRLW